jgi:hypothetical protein
MANEKQLQKYEVESCELWVVKIQQITHNITSKGIFAI